MSLSATGLTVDDLMQVVPGLTASEAHHLASTDQVTHFFEANGMPRLVPSSSLTSSIENEYQSVDHTVGVEALFIMKPGSGSQDGRMLKWYNILRSIS
ncbi:MAG TPA: hypothetical protein VMW69_11435, partial [Spirochaetia bacterium]|nr:hypothetical protein [Spirochaetia bacterium]